MRALVLVAAVVVGVLVALPRGRAAESNAAPEFVMSAAADLNGDGKAERIALTPAGPSSSKFTLRAGRAKIAGDLREDPIDGLQIVDVDTHDRYREVAVHSPGPSDDDVWALYWYDGKALHHMGTVSRWPTFVGNGDVVVKCWDGWWEPTELYRLVPKTHRLKLVPQEFHYVGTPGTARAAFVLYTDRSKKTVLVTVPEGRKVTLLVSAGEWYLVQSPSGLVGWMRMPIGHEYEYLSGLPAAD
jgi:hypothetical protein